MRADNSAALVTAARRRHEMTRAKAVRALHELQATDAEISFAAVAAAAGISRSWLYAQTDLRAQISHLRQSTRPAARAVVPASQQASQASLRRRLEMAEERVRTLHADNDRLRRELAHALGEQRRDRRTRTGPP
jgi:hypothetical protein